MNDPKTKLSGLIPPKAKQQTASKKRSYPQGQVRSLLLPVPKVVANLHLQASTTSSALTGATTSGFFEELEGHNSDIEDADIPVDLTENQVCLLA